MLRQGRHRLTAWLALVVMLLGAFAPTVSRALAAARGAPLSIEVCTSQGPRWMSPVRVQSSAPASAPTNDEVNDAHDGPASTILLDACPFCLLLADRLGPPPAASVHVFDAESCGFAPEGQALFLPKAFLAAALPRGPPARA